jgi:hypothetical protein
MNILSWLLGKKKTHTPTTADNQDYTTNVPERHGTVNREADNLRRWRESGAARTWVEARKGSWNHEDWLTLLEELKRSSFWPMQPDAVGLILEDAKREWLQRN